MQISVTIRLSTILILGALLNFIVALPLSSSIEQSKETKSTELENTTVPTITQTQTQLTPTPTIPTNTAPPPITTASEPISIAPTSTATTTTIQPISIAPTSNATTTTIQPTYIPLPPPPQPTPTLSEKEKELQAEKEKDMLCKSICIPNPDINKVCGMTPEGVKYLADGCYIMRYNCLHPDDLFSLVDTASC